MKMAGDWGGGWCCMGNMQSSPRSVVSLIPLLLVLGACSSTAPVSQPQAPAAAAARPAAAERFPVNRIKKGMTEQQLRALFGEPRSIEPMEGADPRARLWTYSREIVREYRDVLAGTREVPVWAGLNSTSGNSVKMVQEPVTRQELHCVQELTIILLYEGKYVNHKQRLEESSSFVN